MTIKPFTKKLTPKTAQEYFELYTRSMDECLEVFRSKIEKEGVLDMKKLDYSPESLVPFWTWAYPQMETGDRLIVEKGKLPVWYNVECGSIEWDKMHTNKTLWLVDAIAYYLAKVFMK